MIEGLIFKKLVTHSDNRGFFREILRSSPDKLTHQIGQVSHSEVGPGIIKAWHGHKYQFQWTYVLKGTLRVVVTDLREYSITKNQIVKFNCGDSEDYSIYGFPPGVFHGYENISGAAQIIYITSGIYDLNDELRIPKDSNKINFDW